MSKNQIDNEFEWHPGKPEYKPKYSHHISVKSPPEQTPDYKPTSKEIFSFFGKTIVVFITIGAITLLYNTFKGDRKEEINHVGKCIENKLQDTTKPLYCEETTPKNGVCLWDMDNKGKYGEIDVEVVTSYRKPARVFWFNPVYLEEIKKRGLIVDSQSKEFTPAEKFKADRVANEQVFQDCLSKERFE